MTWAIVIGLVATIGVLAWMALSVAEDEGMNLDRVRKWWAYRRCMARLAWRNWREGDR